MQARSSTWIPMWTQFKNVIQNSSSPSQWHTNMNLPLSLVNTRLHTVLNTLFVLACLQHVSSHCLTLMSIPFSMYAVSWFAVNKHWDRWQMCKHTPSRWEEQRQSCSCFCFEILSLFEYLKFATFKHKQSVFISLSEILFLFKLNLFPFMVCILFVSL